MVTEPKSMEELIYFTNRDLGAGLFRVWVYKQDCPKCGKAKMGKPTDEKTGKVKIRAKEYVCPECRYMVEKKEYEETLAAEFKGKCPNCKNEVEGTVPFKRKSVAGVQTLRIKCPDCGGTIDVTKKMAAPKK
ncbi:hypothetical protein KY328_00935 [Candidatus Woesearchaeota archaeon]|nr:hypothetical protein [Candidatus Woesearchaeota archaeon]MBW3021461.1 hypothetical protein [Candidatus Woesearchaeota archaeon]